MSDLKNCPFCGSANVRAEISCSGCYVTCDDCDAVGSQTLDDSTSGMEEAVSAWNRASGRMPKTPGMAVQALAAEIVDALLADEKDGGYDLTAGMFGQHFSDLVRRWAALEYKESQRGTEL